MKRNYLTKCKILIYSNQRNQVINLLLEKEYKYESSRIDKDHNLILIIKMKLDGAHCIMHVMKVI